MKYKVLKRSSGGLRALYRDYTYAPGVWLHDSSAGQPGDQGCLRGFYATDIDGLPFSRPFGSREVWRCTVGGKEYGTPPYKTCYSRLKLIELCQEDEVRKLARAEQARLGYLLEESIYPADPLIVRHEATATAEEIDWLHEWSGVWREAWRGVGDAIDNSEWKGAGCVVWRSVRNDIGIRVWHHICWDRSMASAGKSTILRDSVWHSMAAYVGSLFPGATRPELTAAAALLWRAGLVPSFDGHLWRLHSGNGVVYAE